ncbi:alpha-glucosidase C-terminal domain-containing protein [Streptomyces spinoverrucosus]|uniref:alpha-amylase family glycosyl hydrolase n=1 Tax=Streptomyces spinoverrucosus TaxID=284043 RepID=UPI0018C4072C|nr:alpha-amylase family glycosyl hydrolase [Streptomyces spinoverrucosus]MBG0851378.1 alpha-glucosidase C-terminal domain-containing protein [Streptomyces spinoverrucosus]
MKHSRINAALCGALGLALVVPLSLASSDNPAQAAGGKSPTTGVTSARKSSDFQNLNGFMWYYNTWFGYKYTDIEKDLDNLKSRGIRVLGFFTPNDGDKNTCDGCSPLDFYQPPPQNGTMQDWKNLVDAAHRKGLKVVSYFVNVYMDEKSPYFKKAEKQYAAGDRTSREVSTFRWTNDPKTPLPTLRMGPPDQSSWEWSETAGAYYWKLWFGPGFDYDLPSARAEVTRIEKHWLDTGIDGFMWDVGTTDERWKYHAVDLPKSYSRNELWLTTERANSADASEWQQYGFNSWFNYKDDDTSNDYGRIVNGTTDADGLEAALRNTDIARAMGSTTYTWSIWGDDAEKNLKPHKYPTYPKDDVMRVQEAALLAGSGILYGSGMYDQYIRWSTKLRNDWERVLRTVNTNEALLPAASRKRVPAGDDPKTYAMRRTSENGKQTALLVYNFNSTPRKVTVDLEGTGIDTNQKPKDLYNGGSAPAIDGRTYTVNLPAYGFKILDVSDR